MEGKTLKSYALRLASRIYNRINNCRKSVSIPQFAKKVLNSLGLLKFAVLLGVFGVYICSLLPLALILIPAKYGVMWGLASAIIFFSPVIYLVAKEIWRQAHLLPMHDGIEISTEAQMKAMEEYIKLLGKKGKERC